MKTKWKTLGDVEVPDIIAFVVEATKLGQDIHIGTDSLQTGRYSQFVSVAVIHTPSKGGRVAYCREIVPRITSLRERLLKEVWLSIEIAMEISGRVKSEITVHIDANAQERYMSSRYVQELAGMAIGQGFKTLIKPESWAASHAADHVVRSHGKMPRQESRTGLNPVVRRTA